MTPKFLDSHIEIARTQCRLPHWQQDGRTYFVTFRLADSIPAALARDFDFEKRTWLDVHPQPWTPLVEQEYHQRFSVHFEHLLDECSGECLLRDPGAAKIVGDALGYFEGTRSAQISWVVMPNHVHAVFSLLRECKLEKIVGGWKGFMARELNRYFGRMGSVWQRDYYDRLIRDGEHLMNVAGYIRRNPVKAGLREGEFLHWERPDLFGGGEG